MLFNGPETRKQNEWCRVINGEEEHKAVTQKERKQKKTKQGNSKAHLDDTARYK